ncbi:DNA adenine methylase [Variovorax sp. UC74_104]|uniref:DNA adenine methylase n=1 Tax=Variovorax sp. UC74_104 TaxID=3374555 RepID=UPI003756972B
MTTEQIVLPFLKWAGGKRWLTHLSSSMTSSGTYIEPFVGSGAMFFAIKPKKAMLSDANRELIEAYKSVRDDPILIEHLLREHQAAHNKEHYYRVRKNIPLDAVERSARFIYLNRTCWNGLYRVNKRGEFNVPIGTKSAVLMASDNWSGAAALLRKVQLIAGDFEQAIDKAVSGDLVFADPPYTVKHNLNGFLKYNEFIFSWEDQLRLYACLLRAKRRGVKVVSTNAAHQSIWELYKEEFDIEYLSRASVLAGKASARGRYEEFLITSNHE